MGQLSNVTWETQVVEATPGTYIEFRGLNVVDLMKLGWDNPASAEKLFGTLKDRQDKNPPKTEDAVKSIIMDTFKETPDLLLRALAIAAEDDTPEGIAALRRAPVSFQLEAVEAVIILSIRSEAELKKVGEVLLRLITKVAAMLEAAKPETSKAGSGKSVRG